jgi:hypothetical protein
MKPKPEFAKLLRKRKPPGRPKKRPVQPPTRKPYTEREPDLAETDRLDLQAHLLKVHGLAANGPLEELKEMHKWIRVFAKTRTQG